MKTARLLLAASAAVVIGGAWMGAVPQDQAGAPGIARVDVAGLSYQSGGIGQDEVADMNRNMAPYDLRITFSEGTHNEYVASVTLRILEARGLPVFSLRAAGPLTDVRLPSGHYRVIADFGGIERSGSVNVQSGHATRLHLHWPHDAV